MGARWVARSEHARCCDGLARSIKPKTMDGILFRSGEFGNAGHHPHEPVGPANDEAGKWTDKCIRIDSERTRHRAIQQQFAQGAHDEEDHHAAQRVAEQQARARMLYCTG